MAPICLLTAILDCIEALCTTGDYSSCWKNHEELSSDVKMNIEEVTRPVVMSLGTGAIRLCVLLSVELSFIVTYRSLLAVPNSTYTY